MDHKYTGHVLCNIFLFTGAQMLNGNMSQLQKWHYPCGIPLQAAFKCHSSSQHFINGVLILYFLPH